MGGSYRYMIRMHAYRCDKSNDISICNLKEFECIQEYKNNSDIFLKKIWESRFKIQECEKIFSGNLEP